mgnify:CR=1 FL=1
MDWTTFGADSEIGVRALWSVVIIGGAYLVGHLINALVVGRLARLAGRTDGQWDDIVLDEFRRRVPFWSVLAGASLALSQWTLSTRALDNATNSAWSPSGS